MSLPQIWMLLMGYAFIVASIVNYFDPQCAIAGAVLFVGSQAFRYLSRK